MRLCELNEKLTIARNNGFIFNQIKKLTIKFRSRLRYINIRFYSNVRVPMCHRQFFKLISQNRGYVEKFCNVM